MIKMKWQRVKRAHVIVGFAAVVCMTPLISPGSARQPLSPAELARVWVGGEYTTEEDKCCQPKVRESCEDDPVLACFTNPVCSDAVTVNSNCPDHTCEPPAYATDI